MRPWITSRLRRCTRRRKAEPSDGVGVVQINTKSRAKNGKTNVLIVGGRFCGRAKPSEWVSRAANPLHLRTRCQN